jgi:transcription antitermination factor NusA-like protein
MQMGVPDHLLGSIIGKGGSIVREIMAITNTTIQVSQKDEYLANTNKHRAVNVKGSQSQVQVALQIIMAKLLST